MSRGSEIQAPILVMLIFLMAVQILALFINYHIDLNTSTSIVILKSESSAMGTSFSLIFALIVLVISALLLLVARLKQERVIEGFTWLCLSISIFYVLNAFLEPKLQSKFILILLLVILTLGLLLLLHLYPRWYVIDSFCILICAGFSSIFGMAFDVRQTLLFMVIMAIYDAISVYKTGHMVFLAELMIRIKAPLLFVLPKRNVHSFGKDPDTVSSQKDRKSQVYILGLGDAIIPTILVISAYLHVTAPHTPGTLGIGLPTLGAMIGTYLGFLVIIAALSDRYQAGLPFLNSGAILGFLVGCIAAGVQLF
jgi:presenilin-like A22 family membrane protease